MKNGIDILLIIVLLATIGLLIYFGMGDISPVEDPTATSTPGIIIDTATAGTNAPTTKPTWTSTATLIPASVTIPTKTLTPTVLPSRTPTPPPTMTLSPTSTLSTDSPVTQVDQEIKSGIQRGNMIVKAIEVYHGKTGQYPETLNDLVPAYMPNIPITTTGQAFFYRLFDPSSPLAAEVYWVSFRAIDQDHVACTYYRRLDYWDCDFASP